MNKIRFRKKRQVNKQHYTNNNIQVPTTRLNHSNIFIFFNVIFFLLRIIIF